MVPAAQATITVGGRTAQNPPPPRPALPQALLLSPDMICAWRAGVSSLQTRFHFHHRHRPHVHVPHLHTAAMIKAAKDATAAAARKAADEAAAAAKALKDAKDAAKKRADDAAAAAKKLKDEAAAAAKEAADAAAAAAKRAADEAAAAAEKLATEASNVGHRIAATATGSIDELKEIGNEAVRLAKAVRAPMFYRGTHARHRAARVQRRRVTFVPRRLQGPAV